jgi:hypothetical protein
MRNFLENFLVGFMFGFIVFMVVLIFSINLLLNNSYREGQLDMQRGIVKYEIDERAENGWIKLKEAGE